MPVSSSAVSAALKTFSGDPKCSTSFRALVGPKPGVSRRATHSNRCVVEGESTALGTGSLRADCTYHAENAVKVRCHNAFVTIVESMRKLRISAISYLNTAPLMWDFEHGEAGSHFEISYTIPSGCARALAEGSGDIGIIPAAAYTQIPGLQILPDVAIASRRAVTIDFVGQQSSARKSAHGGTGYFFNDFGGATQNSLENGWAGSGNMRRWSPRWKRCWRSNDAALVIGDPALQIDRTRYYTLDLAEEWIRITGKPFVFAFWAVRGEVLSQADTSLDLARIFRESRDHGLSEVNIHTIIQEWAPRLRLEEADVREYLTKNIDYELDSECIAGLQLFYQYAAEIGALPPASGLRFLGAVEPTAKP